jgi:hypothetical protein
MAIKDLFKKLNVSNKDWIYIIVLIIGIGILSYPGFIPKGDCEVARPGYKCDSAHNVMIENCKYWGNYSCRSSLDPSLPQIEWYIGNLCEITKNRDSLDCSNLKTACNQITQANTCPI